MRKEKRENFNVVHYMHGKSVVRKKYKLAPLLGCKERKLEL